VTILPPFLLSKKYLKNKLFSFFVTNFMKFCNTNKKKCFKNFTGEKNVWKENFKHCFFSPFLQQRIIFRRILNHFLTGPYIPIPVVKNKRGFWGDTSELFSLKSVNSAFSQNRCAVSLTNTICILWHCSMTPPPPSELRWAIAQLFFNGVFVRQN
jgi:hypothetical protein